MLQMPYSLEAFSLATASNTACYLQSTLSLKFAFLSNTETHVWTFKFISGVSRYHLFCADALRVNISISSMVINYETHFLHFQEVVNIWFCRILQYCHYCTLSLPLVAILLYFLLVPYQPKKYEWNNWKRKQALPDILARYFIDCTMFNWNCKTFTRPSVLSFLLYRSWLLCKRRLGTRCNPCS